MKINNQTSSAAQAVSAENRESFMSLLRDSLRVKAEQMLEEEGRFKDQFEERLDIRSSLKH